MERNDSFTVETLPYIRKLIRSFGFRPMFLLDQVPAAEGPDKLRAPEVTISFSYTDTLFTRPVFVFIDLFLIMLVVQIQ